jgi:hypothetical protein
MRIMKQSLVSIAPGKFLIHMSFMSFIDDEARNIP